MSFFFLSMPKCRNFSLIGFVAILIRSESRITLLRWEPIWFSIVDNSIFLVPINFWVVGVSDRLHTNDGSLNDPTRAVFFLRWLVLLSDYYGLWRWHDIMHLMIFCYLIHLIVLLTRAFGVFICCSCRYLLFLLAFHHKLWNSHKFKPLNFQYFSDRLLIYTQHTLKPAYAQTTVKTDRIIIFCWILFNYFMF